MDPKKLFADERLMGGPLSAGKRGPMCVYCGNKQPETRDHVPSKVLLDEPYPEQLPVVGACENCNASFSLDEQYLACLIDCVVAGSVDTSKLQRDNVKRILTKSPKLKQRLANSMQTFTDGSLTWAIEVDRVEKVILKLARGHAAYELYPQIDLPSSCAFAPLEVLTADQRSNFERDVETSTCLVPEVGTRAFLRALGTSPDGFPFSKGGWVHVQHGRYRFAAIESESGISVRVVLSEYLAGQVIWLD